MDVQLMKKGERLGFGPASVISLLALQAETRVKAVEVSLLFSAFLSSSLQGMTSAIA